MSAEGLKNAVLETARREAGQIVAQARAAAEQEDKQAAVQVQRSAADDPGTGPSPGGARAGAGAGRPGARTAPGDPGGQEQAAGAGLRQGSRRLPRPAEGSAPRAVSRGTGGDRPAGGQPAGPAWRQRRSSRPCSAGRARVEEDPALEAGYIVVRSDFRLDRSLAARLEEIRTELRTKVAAASVRGRADESRRLVLRQRRRQSGVRLPSCPPAPSRSWPSLPPQEVSNRLARTWFGPAEPLIQFDRLARERRELEFDYFDKVSPSRIVVDLLRLGLAADRLRAGLAEIADAAGGAELAAALQKLAAARGRISTRSFVEEFRPPLPDPQPSARLAAALLIDSAELCDRLAPGRRRGKPARPGRKPGSGS